MKKFTKEETMLMMLYNPGSREGLIRELAGMKVQLQPEAFQQLDLYPD